MRRIILTVGLPRSGKSTWAKAQGLPIVNPDSIRLALHGTRFLAKLEGWVWLVARLMVEALHLAGHGIVIVDATHVTEKRRAQWREWFPSATVETRIIGTSPEECIRRATAEGDEEIIPVIHRMAGEWDLHKPWERAA